MLSVARQSARVLIRGGLNGSCYAGRTLVASAPARNPVSNGLTILRRLPSRISKASYKETRKLYNSRIITIKCQQIQSLFRQTGTVAVTYASRASPKTKKIVGAWMLTCSGMVFVAVALGIVGYILFYCCIKYVVGVVVDQTYGK